MTQKKKILVCPLNWGLGHASRMVPVIRLLGENNFDVLIASSKESLSFLRGEFPDLITIDFPNYRVKYSSSNSQILRMLVMIPNIFLCTIKEHFKLRKIIKHNNIDIVISDNRFGLWCRKAYSIFVTHQLKVIYPKPIKWLGFTYSLILKELIKNYDECWVPDWEGEKNLSGVLSHYKSKLTNVEFIGPLSRFNRRKDNKDEAEEYDILFVLSGPEPQRSLLEEIIYYQIQDTNYKVALVRGTYQQSIYTYNVPIYDVLNTTALDLLINKSRIVVCRSGYSSIMDLVVKNKPAVLIPTPGQTEQEYLAKHLSEKGIFKSILQRDFSLEKINVKDLKKPDFINLGNRKLLERIENLQKK